LKVPSQSRQSTVPRAVDGGKGIGENDPGRKTARHWMARLELCNGHRDRQAAADQK
jgi:hypothetical protein